LLVYLEERLLPASKEVIEERDYTVAATRSQQSSYMCLDAVNSVLHCRFIPAHSFSLEERWQSSHLAECVMLPRRINYSTE
jgi:hypothetical protein